MTQKELKQWRKEHKLTQKELGDLLHVTSITIARWETGMRKIPPFLYLALIGLEKSKMKGGETNETKKPIDRGRISHSFPDGLRRRRRARTSVQGLGFAKAALVRIKSEYSDKYKARRETACRTQVSFPDASLRGCHSG